MRYVSYWLMPAEPDRTFLQRVIQDLARRYTAPLFAPHVTIYSGESPAGEDPAEIVAAVIPGMGRLRLDIERIQYSPTLSKTLFVQFAASLPLQRLSDAIRDLVRQPAAYRLDPHLSLLYQELSAADKQYLATTIQLPQPTVVFDAVSAIVSPHPMRTPDDVNTWQLSCYRPLVR